MQISLNGGDWLFKDYIGEDWRWRDAHQPGTRDLRFWRRGSVPGSVHHDLWTQGAIPNPYYEMNSLLLEWIPARTWLYKKTFTVDAALRGQRIQLRFEGVDYEAEFFLNGAALGRHRSMYTPAAFEVSDLLHYDEPNLVAVVLAPAPHEEPQVGRTSRVRTHKSRMTYWWDFCPRMIHVGIWQDVLLNVTGAVRIEDVFVRPQLSADYATAAVALSVAADAAQAETVAVETTIRFEGDIIASATQTYHLAPGRAALKETLRVDQPRLWWPNGAGDQPLYEAEVAIYPLHDGQAGAAASDTRVVPFGIRQIELARNDASAPEARPYTLVVNGRKLYIKGWNWVPLDVLYGAPRPQKLAHLLRLAKDAHVNLLRVWGGGLIETEAFYNLADRYGILIWQEFIQSSSGIENTPSEAREFIDLMQREAEAIIPRRRNHPALALWCGGNELTTGDIRPLDDQHPLLAALKEVVARLDPDRLWLPTSPSGPVFGNTLADIAAHPAGLHDVHGPWEYQGVSGQYELYNRGTSLLHSEFGVEGITNLRTLNATIAPEHQQPVTLDNPYWQHLGAWWVKAPVWQETFGAGLDAATWVRATQFMQAEGLRYALEADRRRKYHNSGTLPWQFNEPYPMAACTSAVDYYGQPKPVYYAVARAYQPLLISAKYATIAWEGRPAFEAELWANHSGVEAIMGADLQARLIGLDGRVRHEWNSRADLPANRAAALRAIEAPLEEPGPFFLDLRLDSAAGLPLAHSRYIFTNTPNLAALLDVLPTTLLVEAAAERDRDSWDVRIENTGAQAALFIWLEADRAPGAAGFGAFSDNHFCLLPHETRMIKVSWFDVPRPQRALVIAGWNTPAQRIAAADVATAD